jgi:hypothetical protein
MTDPRKQAEQAVAERERLRKLKLAELEASLTQINKFNDDLKPFLQEKAWQIFDKSTSKRTDLKKNLVREYAHFTDLQKEYNKMIPGLKLQEVAVTVSEDPARPKENALAILNRATRILAAVVEIEQKEQQMNKKTEQSSQPEVKIEVVHGEANQGFVSKGRIVEPEHYGFTEHVTATPIFEKVEEQNVKKVEPKQVAFDDPDDGLDHKHSEPEDRGTPKTDLSDEFLAQYLGLLETIHQRKDGETKAESETLDALEQLIGKDKIRELNDRELLTRGKANIDLAEREKTSYGVAPTRRGSGR